MKVLNHEVHEAHEAKARRWSRVPLRRVMRRHNEIIHPGDRETGKAIFVGLEHVESGTGRRIGSGTVDLACMTGRKPTFRRGHIVYGYLRPYLNKVWVAEFDGCSSVDQFAFEVDSGIANVEFVAAYLRSEVFLKRAAIVTTTGQLPRISIEEIEATEIDLPPLAEQKRIAERLAQQLAAADRARAAAQARLAAAQTLPAAYLREGFSRLVRSADTRRLGDISDIGSGITLGKRPHAINGREVHYLRVANVQDGHLLLDSVYKIRATDEEIADLTLRRGDLVLTEGGDRDKLGRGTWWNDELPECLFQNHIFRVRLHSGIVEHEFFGLQIRSAYAKDYFLAHAKQTTGIATINRRILANLPVLLPPIAEQRRIAADLAGKLAGADALIARCREELAAIDALPAALLREAFDEGGNDG